MSRGAHRRPTGSRAARLVAAGVVAALVLASALGAWAFWTAGSFAGSNGASGAARVNQGATPTATANGQSVTVTWAATTLTTGQAVSGYLVKRYNATTLAGQTILTNCAGTIATTTCTENSVPAGSWVYTVTPLFATNWQGSESAKSNVVIVDTTPPANVLSLSNVTGGAFLSGTTLYYRGTAAGSFTLSNALTDGGSGAGSSATAALGGTATGWTHTPSTVSTPAGGPYVSNAFSWTAGTSTAPTETVTGRDAAANSATTTLTFTNDSTVPTAGTITYANGYVSGRSLSVSFTTGTDAGSGIGTRKLQRASAALTGGTSCGTFSGFTDLAVNPASPFTDTYLTNGTCYEYQYVVFDNAGNQTTATSANIVKVDYGTAVTSTAGLVSLWRLGESVGVSDTFTGTGGTDLVSHTADVGGAWSKGNGTATGVISTANRLRKNGTGFVYYYPTTPPTFTDGAVEADVVVLSTIADQVCLMGRWDNTNSYYKACYNQPNGEWELSRYKGTAPTGLTMLGTYVQTLNVGQTYHLRLNFIGTAISLWVDGVQRVAATDSVATGTSGGDWPGIEFGDTTSSAAPSDTTGYHLDNFQMIPRAADSKGSNTAEYLGGATLGQGSATVNDTNTSAKFDGTRTVVEALSPTSVPTGSASRTVELWFKTSSTAQQTLFDYGSLVSQQEFGLWLNANATSMTAWGWGTPDDVIFPLPYSVTDGAWHHVAETYNGTSITLYIDGTALPSQAATRNTVLNSYGFDIGGVPAPGDFNSGNYFNGYLDEVALYNTVLSQATITNHYQLGTTPPAPSASGPTGGSVDATGLVGTGSRYATSTTLTLNFAKGSDPDGLAASGSQLLRATAPLTAAGGTADGTCGTYGTYSLVALDPTAPRSDTVNDQACYRYQYVVADALGNTTTYVSPDIKVDTTAAAQPGLTFSATSNAYWSGSGSTVYYRSAAASGAFTVTAAATDAASGIAAYTFPALGTNWTSTPGALGVTTYSWSGAPAAPGSPSVTAKNNATGTSVGAAFTLTADDTAPTVGTISYLNGSTKLTSLSVAFTTGTDAGSGVGTRLLQRAQAPLTGGVCGTFGGFSTIATNASSPYVDAVNGGTCYRYQYVVSDNLGNTGSPATSASVAMVTAPYATTVTGTAGILNYWRLGESTLSSDSFTGTAGTDLGSHTGDNGATWTRWAVDTPTALLSNANRLRRNGIGGISYLTSVVPGTADYQVSADVYVASLVTDDAAGVVGRFDTTNTNATRYMARYNYHNGWWELRKDVNGAGSSLGTWTATLTVGQTYNVALDMKGTTIRMLVDGVVRASVTDTSISVAGAAGVRLGSGNTGASSTDTTGLHLDNFRLNPPAADSAGTNRGDYLNTTTLGAPGPFSGTADTAAQFDGVRNAVAVNRQVSTDFSVEFWFKSTQGIGTGANWYNAAALVDNTSATPNQNDWGIALRSDGKVVAGVGNPDTSIMSGAGYNDGAWHQVVFTRSSAGPIVLYVDGTQVASGTGTTAALTAVATITFGRQSGTGTNAFAGYLDDVSVYSAVLSPSTVSGHFNASR